MDHKGSCFCGGVRLEGGVTPREWAITLATPATPGPVAPSTLSAFWKPDAVHISAGAAHIKTFQKTALSMRQFWDQRGGHLMIRHPTLGLVDVFISTIPTPEFKPEVHVNYAETVLPMYDGLPKLKDFPTELGAQARQYQSDPAMLPSA